MTEDKPIAPKGEALLNEFQARRLRVTCEYIDKLLGEVEEILHVTASKAAFPRFVPDVAPVQRRTIEDYIARLRAQLARVLDGQGILRETEFATEQRNPGNTKRVTRIVVTLPAARLRDGVTFVDTPGLGSLATSGAADTLAYLPKCDLGVVLIDAGSTLTTEDLQTILTLQEAAIPVNVLLSKADLLSPEDREKIIQYIGQHIASECRMELPVHPVSVFRSDRELLDRWFGEHILPLYSRSQDLRAASLRRKIGGLRESVIAALQIDLERSKTSPPGTKEQIRGTKSRLRRATGLIEETSSTWEKELEKMATETLEVFRETAAHLMDEWSKNENPAPSIESLFQNSTVQVVQGKVKKLRDSLDTLAVQLRDDLRRSAEELGIADVPTEDEFQSLVRGTPIFDLGSQAVSVTRPVLAGLFGRQFAEGLLAKQLRRELEEGLRKSLRTYSDVLKEWTRVVTSHFLRRFETYAEGYRAQAERSLGGKNLTDEDIFSIQESLKLLGVEKSGGPGTEGQQEGSEEMPPLVRHARKGESQ